MRRLKRWIMTPRGEFSVIAAVLIVPLVVLLWMLGDQAVETSRLDAEQMFFVDGEFSSLETKDGMRGTSSWVLKLKDGQSFHVDTIIDFRPGDFQKQVEVGDSLTLGVIDGGVFEIRVDGQVIHSFETSLKGRRENDSLFYWFVPVMLLLVVAALWIIAAERYHWSLTNWIRRKRRKYHKGIGKEKQS